MRRSEKVSKKGWQYVSGDRAHYFEYGCDTTSLCGSMVRVVDRMGITEGVEVDESYPIKRCRRCLKSLVRKARDENL